MTAGLCGNRETGDSPIDSPSVRQGGQGGDGTTPPLPILRFPGGRLPFLLVPPGQRLGANRAEEVRHDNVVENAGSGPALGQPHPFLLMLQGWVSPDQ